MQAILSFLQKKLGAIRQASRTAYKPVRHRIDLPLRAVK
jgi:hypothetical protein